MKRWAGLVGLIAVVACGGPSAETTVSTTTSTAVSTSAAAPSTTTPSVTTTAAASTSTTVAVPGSPVTLLVADDDGLRRWSEDGHEEWLVRDRAMQAAAPDRVGGVVYQQVETGRFHMVMDPPSSFDGTVRWEWIGDGVPRPIRRLSGPGGVDEIVVSPGPGQTVRMVDTALVDGRPQLAYVRSTHRLDPMPIADTGDLDATRTSELVVIDLVTGAESVVWSQENGWEAGHHDSKLGAGAVVDAWIGYGDDATSIGLYDPHGAALAMPPRPPETLVDVAPSAEDEWMMAGTVRVDLSPDGTVLAYAWTPTHLSAGAASTLAVVSVERTTGAETARAAAPLDADVVPSFVDAAGGRILVGRMSLQALGTPPTLRLGDQGAWVRELQSHLSIGDEPLVADGVFGPRTRTAVIEWQTANGVDPTGVVDARTWQVVLGDGRVTVRLAPLLLEPDGTIREVAAPGSGEPAVEPSTAYGADESGRISLWDA